ncbi:MAG: hypothetical protein Q7T08_09290, partial [Devosia sp.]|nr:hypothetical protein [Devosia sp.]
LDGLEKKVQRMDEEHSRIRAPLVVTGPDGSEIFTVGVDSAGRARATVGVPGGSHLILGINDQGSGISLKDSSGTTRAQIGAGSEQAFVWVEDGVAKSLLGTGTADGSGSGLTVTKGDIRQISLVADKSGGAMKTFDVAGTPIAEISAAEDTPLLLYDLAGKPFFSVGLPQTGKRLLTLGDPSSTRAEMGITTDGSGAFLAMVDKAGISRATMTIDEEEPAFSAADSSGKDIFSVGPKGQGGPVQLTVGDADAAAAMLGVFAGGSGSFVSMQDKSGAQRAAMTADAGEEPILLRNADTAKVFSVGPANGEGGPMRLVIGEEEKGHASMGIVGADGGALVSLFDSAGALRATVNSDKSGSIMLTDADANATFYVGESGDGGPMQIVLGDDGKEHVDIGLFGGGGADGSYFTLYDSAGKERTLISTDATKLMSLYDPDGQPVFTVAARSSNGDGIDLKVGSPDKAHFQTGVLSDGSGTYLSLYDNGGTERAQITATEKSTQMQLTDANMTADLGSDLLSDKAGLFMSRDDVNFASIRFDKAQGGSIRLGDEAGKQMVGIGRDQTGGGGVIGLNGSGGGKPVAQMSASGEGGSISLIETSSGKARVHMEASTTGDFALEGDGGSFVAKGGTAGRMQIAAQDGTVLVDVYETKSGLGAVAVGPGGDGVAASLGNIGKPASALLGKK